MFIIAVWTRYVLENLVSLLGRRSPLIQGKLLSINKTMRGIHLYPSQIFPDKFFILLHLNFYCRFTPGKKGRQSLPRKKFAIGWVQLRAQKELAVIGLDCKEITRNSPIASIKAASLVNASAWVELLKTCRQTIPHLSFQISRILWVFWQTFFPLADRNDLRASCKWASGRERVPLPT